MTKFLALLLLAIFLFAAVAPASARPAMPMLQAERAIASSDHEIAILYSASGRELARFQGDGTHTIVWTVPNGTLTHNHPCTDLPDLSPADLATAARGNLREIRAVSDCGAGFTVCRAWRTGARWRAHFDVMALNAEIHDIIDYRPLPDQIALLHWFAVTLAARFGFGYACEGVNWMTTTPEQTRVFNEKLRPVIERLGKDYFFISAIKRQSDPQGWIALFKEGVVDKLDDGSVWDGRPIPTVDDVARLIKMMDSFIAFMDNEGWTDLIMHFALNPEQV